MGDIVGIRQEHRSREDQAREVIEFLNTKAGRNFRPTRVNLKFIEDRLREGYTLQDCKQVIAMKVREWSGDPKMDQYLRPATIFNCTNFNQYAGFLA